MIEFYSDADVCTDCLMFHASGDMSYLALQDDEDEVLERMDKTSKELIENDFVWHHKDVNESEPYFSRCSCDLCGISLAGDRHEGTLFKIVKDKS